MISGDAIAEAAHPRNILIFADGTGNEGGLLPDEAEPTSTSFIGRRERLALPAVRNFDTYGPYRPVNLKAHPEAKPFFERSRAS